MSALLPLSQQPFQVADGSFIVVSVVNYLATSDTMDIDASLVGTPVAFHLNGGLAPTGAGSVATYSIGGRTLPTGRVTLTSGTPGKVMVITRHIGNASAIGSPIK